MVFCQHFELGLSWIFVCCCFVSLGKEDFQGLGILPILVLLMENVSSQWISTIFPPMISETLLLS